jgi:4-aminobutyrate aminotransferase-like enzyme
MSSSLSKRILEIVERDKKFFPRGISIRHYPLVVKSAEGYFLKDIEGKEYIDFISGAVVYPFGHLHEEVVTAIEDQLKRCIGYPIVYFYAVGPILLAERLIKITPGMFDKKVLLGFPGSDAVETAILISRAARKARHVVSFHDSFHGSLYYTLSASGVYTDQVKKKALASSEAFFVPYPNPYRNPYGIGKYENPVELSNEVLNELEKILTERGSHIATVLFEPVQGDGGIIVPPSYFPRQLRRLCDEHGVILVDDEAIAGVGRTGQWWGIKHYDVAPDPLIAAKGLGSGMPISAVIGRADVMDYYPEGSLGCTLAGHALSVVAALATVRVIERENLVERARLLGGYIIKRLRELEERYEIVGDVRGKGLLISVEIVSDRSRKMPDKPKALKIV